MRMRQKSLSKKIFVIGATTMVVLFFMMRGTGSMAELFLWRVAEPLTQFSSAVIARFGDISAIFGSASDLTQRIETLEREKIALIGAAGQVASLRRENALLREQYELPQAQELEDFPLINADVIGYNPGATKEWIIINRGSADGVAIGMAVVLRSGIFVGVLSHVAQHSAQVRLITSAQSVVRSETQMRTRGIVRGASNLSARFTMVERSQPLADGDSIFTVRNGRIPNSVLIGTAYNVRVSDDGLFQEALVLPAYDARLRDRVSVVQIRQDF